MIFSASNAVLNERDRSIAQAEVGYHQCLADRARHSGTLNPGIGVSRMSAICSPAELSASSVRLVPSRHAAGETRADAADGPGRGRYGDELATMTSAGFAARIRRIAAARQARQVPGVAP